MVSFRGATWSSLFHPRNILGECCPKATSHETSQEPATKSEKNGSSVRGSPVRDGGILEESTRRVWPMSDNGGDVTP